MRIKDLPPQERPRELLLQHGPHQLTNTQHIAILLRTGHKGASVIQVAQNLLQKYDHSLCALAQAQHPQISQTKGIGRDKAITLISAFTLAQRMAKELRPQTTPITTPQHIADHLRDQITNPQLETCAILLLNTRNHIIRTETISTGILNSVLIHPREVYRPAILHNAAKIAIAHNHPSGDTTPSPSDIQITQNLAQAGKTLNIELIDHIILGHPPQHTSLKQLGHIPNP